jgi:serine phosphatase RsbU (regulator of sigma subunit)/CHASE2 domain-containing sensor protein
VSEAAAEAGAPSFRKIRFAGAAALAVLAAIIALESPARARIQALWFDSLQIVSPRKVESQPATVVAIDDRSIEALGQWPWPRTVLARLIDAIARYQPAAIGVDILMPEVDRLSPEHVLAAVRDSDPALAERLAQLPRHDAQLAASVAAAPVVMTMAESPWAKGTSVRVAPVAVVPAGAAAGAEVPARLPVPAIDGVLRSIDEIDAAAAGHGVISTGKREDVIRRIPLVFDIGGTLAPALSIEMLRVALGEPRHRVHFDGTSVLGLSVGDFATATEADGAVRAYYSHRSTRRLVSAIDVLEGKADPEKLAAKLVVIGVTALVLLDYQLTALREWMPGSEIHVQLLENLFDGTLLLRPRWAPVAELGGFALLGALLVWVTPLWRPGAAAATALACVAIPLAGAYAAFRSQRLLFDAATPGLALLLLFGLLLVLTLAEASRQRKALEGVVQRQREQAAYVAGEMQAAHRIQTGILPRADALAGETRVDLAATMTPARVVGGDLYDFFRLDRDRLFMLVGDVAGKGLSASIFMAVSKALYKSEVLRSAGGTVGAHMTAANAEVSRDNSESLFVTAFAAILDLATGELSYCNAGHENPRVRAAAGSEVAQLDEGGGPPLCAIDDYAYEEARHGMRPGEWLVVVTDGVTEAQNGAGELYGVSRLEALLARLDPQTGAAAVIEAIRADVAAFVAGAEASDDLTALVLRWLGGGAAAS